MNWYRVEYWISQERDTFYVYLEAHSAEDALTSERLSTALMPVPLGPPRGIISVEKPPERDQFCRDEFIREHFDPRLRKTP